MNGRILRLMTSTMLMAPGLAFAGGASVAPLVADGVKDEVALNVTNLVSMELDFMGQFDTVNQLETRPSTLDKACAASASCLAKIQKAAGTEALVTGVLTPGTGKDVTLQLVYVNAGKLVRTKTFTSEGTSSVLADKMGAWMEELVKGVTQADKAKADDLGNLDALSSSDIFDDDEEDEDDDANVPIKTPRGAGVGAEALDMGDELMDLDATPAEIAAKKKAEENERKAEASRAASEAKKSKKLQAEEAKKAEIARREEEERQVAEAAKAEEAARIAAAQQAAEEAATAQAAEQARIAEEERVAEIARKEEAAARVAAARKAAEASAAEEAAAEAEAERRAQQEAVARREAEAADQREAERVALATRQAEEAQRRKTEAAAAAERAQAAKLAAERAQAAKTAVASSNDGSADASDEESWENITFAKPDPSAITIESIEIQSAASMIKVESADESGDDFQDESSGTHDDAYADAEDAFVDQDVDSTRKSSADIDEKSGKRKSFDEQADDSRAPKKSSGAKSNDYDDDSRATTKSSGSKSSGSKGSSDAGDVALIGVAGRLGYTRFQVLGFLTYGVEVSVRPTQNVAIVGGMEAYSVRRTIPESLLQDGQPSTTWNTIFPVNLGVQYKGAAEHFQPYFGADGIFIPSYVREQSGIAGGFRARLGFDYLLNQSVALNLNAGAGVLSGENFEKVEDNMQSTGLAPQISAGTVFLF